MPEVDQSYSKEEPLLQKTEITKEKNYNTHRKAMSSSWKKWINKGNYQIAFKKRQKFPFNTLPLR